MYVKKKKRQNFFNETAVKLRDFFFHKLWRFFWLPVFFFL